MQHPREGMMAVVRNRRAMITGVAPLYADEQGRFHLVDVEYTDGFGAEVDQVLTRARAPQPVRARMGERFLDLQLAQSPKASWAECEAHAKAIRDGGEAPAQPPAKPAPTTPSQPQLSLFGSGR